MSQLVTMHLTPCPMDGAHVTRKRCEACSFHRRFVGCPQVKRSVPEDYCTRHCPHQAANRGAPDGSEGPQPDGGPARLAPLAEPALCGAPAVVAKCGGIRPVFASAGGVAPFEDPASNITPACSYPREVRFQRALIQMEEV